MIDEEPLAMPAEESLAISVPLPNGAVTVPASWGEPDAGAVRGTVIVAHGAGAGMQHPFLVGFSDALRDAGFATLRFDFPYRAQGRRMPGPAAHAIATWNAVVEVARGRSAEQRIWAAGKSYGGRMASMAVADGLAVDGLIYLGYPLHAPGKPEKPRADHLPVIQAPQLFVEGTADPFIQPIGQFEEAVSACQDARVAWVDGGGHSFEVRGQRRSSQEVGASIASLVLPFIR